MTLTLGFSPCPNDTFIFDAMVHGKIDTEGLSFEPILEDVESLNQRAMTGQLDITKLSYHAFAWCSDQYLLLDSGSALGNHCGPLLISKQPMTDADIAHAKIAIPGKYTTANFLFGIAYGKSGTPFHLTFSDIEDAVLSGKADAGVIIHENRFTYAQKGLHLVKDLGAHWEDTTGWPIPLGGIVVSRKLPREVMEKVNRIMQRSVAYAFDHPTEVMSYVRCHAQEMEEAVMKAHIDLYVNEYTLNLGHKGKAAVRFLFDLAAEKGLTPTAEKNIFLFPE